VIVEFATGQIRVWCTAQEREELLRGRAVKLEVALPGRRYVVVSVAASALDAWRLDADPTGLWLTVPHAELAAETSEPPASELSHDFPADSGHSVRVRVGFTTRG